MTVRQLYVQAEDYRARDDRLLISALLAPGSGPLGRAAGGVWGQRDLLMTMTASHECRIDPGIAAIVWSGSHYMLVNDAPLTLSFDPTHATLHRIDSVIAQVYDAEVSGPTSPPVVRVLPGTPAAAPNPPALPAGALRLWNLYFVGGSGNAFPNPITDVRAFEAHSQEGDPRGIAGWWSGLPAQRQVPTTLQTLVGWTVPGLVVGRCYEVCCVLHFTYEVIGAALDQLNINTPSQIGDQTNMLISDGRHGLRVNESVCYVGHHQFQAGNTNAVININAQGTVANGMLLWAGGQYVRCWVKDIGIRPPSVRPTGLSWTQGQGEPPSDEPPGWSTPEPPQLYDPEKEEPNGS